MMNRLPHACVHRALAGNDDGIPHPPCRHAASSHREARDGLRPAAGRSALARYGRCASSGLGALGRARGSCAARSDAPTLRVPCTRIETTSRMGAGRPATIGCDRTPSGPPGRRSRPPACRGRAFCGPGRVGSVPGARPRSGRRAVPVVVARVFAIGGPARSVGPGCHGAHRGAFGHPGRVGPSRCVAARPGRPASVIAGTSRARDGADGERLRPAASCGRCALAGLGQARPFTQGACRASERLPAPAVGGCHPGRHSSRRSVACSCGARGRRADAASPSVGGVPSVLRRRAAAVEARRRCPEGSGG